MPQLHFPDPTGRPAIQLVLLVLVVVVLVQVLHMQLHLSVS